jgi:hypothetical protein
MKNIKLKITKEQSDLFKHTGNIVSLSNGDVYMNIPYWLKETDKENVYEHLTIEQLPDDIKNERKYSEEEVNELLKLLKQTTEYEVLQSFRDKVEQFKKK